MATRHAVTGGPSKFDLVMALFDGKVITFTLEGHGEQRVLVNGMTALVSDRLSFRITGEFRTFELREHILSCEYDTRNRRGVARVEVKPPLEQLCSQCHFLQSMCICDELDAVCQGCGMLEDNCECDDAEEGNPSTFCEACGASFEECLCGCCQACRKTLDECICG